MVRDPPDLGDLPVTVVSGTKLDPFAGGTDELGDLALGQLVCHAYLTGVR